MTGYGPGGPGRINRHRCRAEGCGALVSATRLMCREHWYQVPRPIRDAVWATWRDGAGVFDPAYRAAVRAAAAAVTRGDQE